VQWMFTAALTQLTPNLLDCMPINTFIISTFRRYVYAEAISWICGYKLLTKRFPAKLDYISSNIKDRGDSLQQMAPTSMRKATSMCKHPN